VSRRYVLDSSALLAFLQDEPGAELVEDLIVADDTEVFISAINLGEVFYIIHRSFGEQAAIDVEAKILDTPKVKVMEATWARVRAAAKIKAGGVISFTGCFGAALADEMDATLVTGDAEFRRLESDSRIKIAWLP